MDTAEHYLTLLLLTSKGTLPSAELGSLPTLMAIYIQNNGFSGQLDESLRANGVLRKSMSCEYTVMVHWSRQESYTCHLCATQKLSLSNAITLREIGHKPFVPSVIAAGVTLMSSVWIATSSTATLTAVDPMIDVTMINCNCHE